MNFTQEYAKRKQEVESYLNQFVGELLSYPQKLHEAMEYSLKSGGKRLRPILLLEAVRMFGGSVDISAVNLALSVECIHTYSLIHDDLPCMDNDEMRRGLPTCHVKFGEANAVLAGDALLNLAYELIFSAIRLTDKPGVFVKAGNVIASAAGGNGLVGGQVCDLAATPQSANVDYIYEHKTGALIKAALKAGAIIGGASEEDVQKIGNFGDLFGYAFQLKDDLLDKDGEKEKFSYLRLYGEQKTAEALKAKTVEALTVLQTIENSEFLTELTADFMERKI